jgi:hypothetical protein
LIPYPRLEEEKAKSNPLKNMINKSMSNVKIRQSSSVKPIDEEPKET